MARENKESHTRDPPIKLSNDFSAEALKARRE